MTELLPTLRKYADMGDRKMNVATLPLDIFELAIAELVRLRDVLEWSENNCPGQCAGTIRKVLEQ